ncbi:Rhodanese-like domain-containing protein [Nemania sp. NC0429]|nr:Rhodanese-like domain-containing protein [Nemania sp. NC0429]
MAASTTAEAPWHAAYPLPTNKNPQHMTREELLVLLKTGDTHAAKNYVLVDLRRADHEGGTIRGSINLPAQSLYSSIPTLYDLFRAAGIRKVIWYCSSSRGRGTRAAGWFDDYIKMRKDQEMDSLILLEGIKGWATAGKDYVEYLDGYDESVWASEAAK